MAKKTGSIEIKVGGGAAAELDKLSDSTKTLKEQVKEAQKEAQILGQKFGDTSKEAVAAQKKLAGLKEELADFNQRIEALNPEAKFKALGTAVQGVAGGFSAAQGAMALLGGESEDLQKTLVKLQGALALSQGINDLRGLGDAFGNLKLVAVDALNGIKTAFLSNPIFFAATAIIGGLVAAFTALGLAESKAEKELREYNARLDKSLEIAKERISVIEQGFDREIALARASGKETFELEQGKLKATIKRVELEIQVLQKKRDFEIKQAKESLDGGFVEAQFTKARSEEIVDTYKKRNDDIKQLRTELFTLNTSLLSSEAEQEKANQDKKKEQYKDYLEDLKTAKKNVDLTFTVEDLGFEEAPEDSPEVKRQKEVNAKLAELDATYAFEKATRDQEARDFDEQQDKLAVERRIQRRRELFDAEVEIATALTSTIGSLGKIFIDNQKKNEDFQKKVAVVQLAVDSAKAVAGAVAAAQTLPFPGNIVAIATGVAAVTANIAKAKELLSKAGASSLPNLNITPNSSSSLPSFANQPTINSTDVNQQQVDSTGGMVTQQVIITQGQLEENDRSTNSLIRKTEII